MKKICRIYGMIMTLIIFQLKSIAQQNNILGKTTSITPYHLNISYTKTSNLIFPFNIKSVDRGSSTVMVQKAKGVENILQLKAAQSNFVQTNLTVVTGDGKFYSFLLDYASDPPALNISISPDKSDDGQSALLRDVSVNDAQIQLLARDVNDKEAFLHKNTRDQKMRLSLKSIYLNENSMWFTLAVKNKSLIDFTPGYTRFFLQNRKTGKRTAVQEKELQPVYHQLKECVKGKNTNNFLFAFKPFTIAKTQEFVIQMGEQNGGRSLVLHINHNTLLNARLIGHE